jgi:hypothetical protein
VAQDATAARAVTSVPSSSLSVPSITPEGDERDHYPPDLSTDRARRRQVSYSV